MKERGRGTVGRRTEKSRYRKKNPDAVKRGKASKRKGARREKELGDRVVKRAGGEAIVRHGNRDVQFVGNGLEHHHVEVKGYKAFSFVKHCHQAEGDAATHGLPRWVVACKANNEPWYGIVDLDDYTDDMQELADLRTIVDALKMDEERAKDEDA